MNYLILAAFLSSFSLFSQVRNKIVVIDTLVTNGHAFFIVGSDLFFDSDNLVESQLLSTNSYPNFIGNVYLRTDTSVIDLVLDSKGGYFTIHNAYNNDSIIRIDRFEVLTNCMNDTTFTQIGYFSVSETGMSENKDEKHEIEVKKYDCEEAIDETFEMKINGKSYEITLEKKLYPAGITSFNGSNRRKYTKKEKYKGNKKIVFQGYSTEELSVYTAKIVLLK